MLDDLWRCAVGPVSGSLLNRSGLYTYGSALCISRRHVPPPRFRRVSAGLCLLAALSFWVLPSASACGLDWNLTDRYFGDAKASPFDGVDNKGNVFLVELLCKTETSKGTAIPVYAVFKSDSATRSPVAGYGWTVPILESTFVPIDENRYRLVQPNGLHRIFVRDKERPNNLSATGNWRAEIRRDTTVASCPCGYKLTYRKGRLSSMEVAEGKFDYTYDNARISILESGVRPVLRLTLNPRTEQATGLTLSNGQTVGIEWSSRPRLEIVDGRRTLRGTEPSLGRLTLPDQLVRTFEYGVTEALNPTLKAGDRQIVWDAVTKKIISDGDWTYDIKGGTEPRANAAIARANTSKVREFWHNDSAKGQETFLDTNGVTTVTTYFTSGLFRSRARKVEQIRGGKREILREYSYDEKGRLIRLRKDQQDTLFIYKKEGGVAMIIRNGKIIRDYTQDADPVRNVR